MNGMTQLSHVSAPGDGPLFLAQAYAIRGHAPSRQTQPWRGACSLGQRTDQTEAALQQARTSCPLLQLLPVRRAELVDKPGTDRGGSYPDDPIVVRIRAAAGLVQWPLLVAEFHGAVLTEL